MAAAIEKELGLSAELVPGNGGIFEAEYDGKVVFTNNHRGGVPDSGVVIAALRAEL